jgi:hypothetical protein
VSNILLKDRHRPERKLEEVLAQRAPLTELKINKTTIHIGKEAGISKAEEELEPIEGGGSTELFRPSDEQVELINQYTYSPKTAEELAVFPAHACNTLWDRDDDRFVPQTLADFDTKDAPFSPLGKSFLIGHNHTSLPVGRIFDKSVKPLSGDDAYLETWQYIPNTDQYKAYLENLDFGIFWAVSVGVMFDGASCSACQKDWSWNPWFCVEGHEKGFHYDLKNDETDDYGYPIPLEAYDPNPEKGVFCGREFVGGKDFYELSQVYLGAQYFAEVTDKVTALKSVEPGGQLTLSREETKALEPKTGDRIAEAIKSGLEIGLSPDGNAVWRDADDLVWYYDVTKESYASLGRADSEWANTVVLLDSSKTPKPPLSEEDGDRKSKMKQDDKETKVPKTALITAASEAELPASLLEKIAEAEDDDGALKAFCSSVSESLKEAEAKLADADVKVAQAKELGELGEQYVKNLRQDVIDMYVKAHQDPQDPQKVSTDTVMKLVDACGNNVDLLKSLHADYLNTAQAKFPETVGVRRSVQPDDPHRGADPADDKSAPSATPTTGASRLHG